MSLFRRFIPGRSIHSSGITGASDTIGAKNLESFAKWQQIEKNRQFVGSYQTAGVLHNYRQQAHEDIKDNDQHYRKYRHDDIIPRTSRRENRSTSRIDHPRSSSVDTTVRSVSPVPQRSSTSFSEPSSRRYNPYS